MNNKDLTLAKIYNDPSNLAGLAGVQPLFREAKKLDPSITMKDVQHFLMGHTTYTRMKPRRVHFPRVKTIPADFMTDVQVDLADMQKLAENNDGYSYILVGIDVLSKRVFVAPLRTKNARDVVQAFEELIEQMPMKPMTIYSDLGPEFKNRLLERWLKQQDIQKHEATSTYQKAALAERAIKNLKQRVYRYFAQKQTQNWVNVIHDIANAINHSVSRVHGMRPVDVNFENAQQVWKHIYGPAFMIDKRKAKPKLKQGDFVRMSVGKSIFEKGYYPSWDDEILEVDEVKQKSIPTMYAVKDLKGEEFRGKFYDEELQKVRKDEQTEYRIERIIETKQRRGGTYYLVKYIGYPDPEWIHESQFVQP